MVFCASGYLGNTEKGVISDANDIQKIISINYANLIQNINAIAQQLEKKEKGEEGENDIVCYLRDVLVRWLPATD